MENAGIAEEKIAIRFDPTLFIFLGTTAGKVGWRLKQLFKEAYGDIPIVKFLSLDIDSNIEEQGSKFFDRNSERIELSGVDPSVVVEHLDNHPFTKAWWPKFAPPPGMLSGAGGSPRQMRLVGRLTFFNKFTDNTFGGSLYSRLSSALNALKLIQRQRETEAIENSKFRFTVNNNAINVFLIFSPCGGTGSSMAFDLAYICRKILENNNPKITSMSMAPSVFLQEIKPEKSAERKKALANAYAWFRENNYLLEHPEWNVRYSNEVNVNIAKPPFDQQYVVGIENAAGQRLSSLDDVANMMAQALFLTSGLSLQANVAQMAANVVGFGERFEGKLCAFSSLAAASLIFPQVRLRDFCASKYSQKVLREGFLATREDAIISRTASLILTRNSLLDKDLIRNLQSISPIPFIHEQALKDAIDVAKAVSIVENQYMEAQLLVKDRIKGIETNYDILLGKAKEALAREVLQFIKQYGISTTIAVLERLANQTPLQQPTQAVTSLNQVIAALNQNGITSEDLKREKTEYELAKDRLKKLDDGFEDKLERAVSKKGWDRKLKAAKESAIKEMKDAIDSELIQSAQDQARKLITELFGEVSQFISELKVATSDIEKMLTQLDENAKRLLKPTANTAAVYEFRREIDVDFQAYYQRFTKEITSVSDFSFIPASISAVSEFCKWVKQGFNADLQTFTGNLFTPMIENLSLLSVIREIAETKGADPRTYLWNQVRETFKYCEPFFKYNKSIGVPNPEEDKLLGIEDDTDELVADNHEDDITVVRTGIKNRVDFLVLEHGLPVHVLDDMATCRQMYDLVLTPVSGKDRPDDPLHVLPEVYKDNEDFMPEKDKEAKQWFSIGFAFKYIVHTGKNYYLDILKDYEKSKARPGKDNLLGNSRESAKIAFAKNSEFVAKVEEAVDKEIAGMGNKEAVAYLDAVIQEYNAKIASLSSGGDRGIVDQYRQELEDIRKYQDALKS